MQTTLAAFIKGTPEGEEADAILRKCVHCGFCNATCPTYQLLGDELDGPRGRIYLMKEVLEGAPVTAKTQLHLDRCLTCRSCETTCPSGVRYGRLVDIGRKIVADRVPRPFIERLKRRALAEIVSRPRVFGPLLKIGHFMRAVLPIALQAKVPSQQRTAGAWPASVHARKMIALAGCAQSALAPDINAATARVLDRIGISLIEAPGAGCCGALRFHLDYQDEGRADMRALIDRWWPYVERGEVEAFVMTASGCGAVVKEYAHFLAHDVAYAKKAARIAAMTKDIVEIIDGEFARLQPLLRTSAIPLLPRRVVFHAPCTLQHGQQLKGLAERLMQAAGIEVVPGVDAHLCCGSAGAYSLLQPALAASLGRNKIAALQANAPEAIMTANIGCMTHLQNHTTTVVRHWIQTIDERLAAR
ncbi:MAG: glycolate oxidase subunit GlcF [Betaproteobacteria bacterium]|nr:glycolate oxidase subunit GlcF [Betaproteobacteria bacterium]